MRGKACVSLSLSALPLSIAFSAAELRSQALGVQPHMAPINAGALAAGYNQPGPTPQMNVPDTIWNNGEGFRANSTADADYGAHLGQCDPGVEQADIHAVEETLDPGHLGPWGWHQETHTDPKTGTTFPVWHFRGYLRPAHLGPYPTPQQNGPWTIEDAAFELFMRNPVPSTTQVLLWITPWSTTGKPSPSDGGRFAYPGSNRYDGLVGKTKVFNFPLPPLDNEIIERHSDPAIPALAAAAGITVISGYIVPRVFGRAEVFEAQRIRELRMAMRLMLMAPATDYRHPPGLPSMPNLATDAPPCMLSSGSFGGLTAPALCVRYPKEFCAATVEVFGPSPRRVLADQFNFEYLATRTGFSSCGGAYSPHDTLEWGTAFRFMDQTPGSPGWDYFNLSPLIRKRRGELYAAMAWVCQDEDTIGHGTDWMSLLTGTRNYTPRFASTSAPLCFTAVDRRCHESGWHTTAIGGVGGAWLGRSDAIEMAPVAYTNWSNQNPVVPPLIQDDGSEDSYAWALDRALPADYVPNPGDKLLLDTSFGSPASPGRTEGAGLALGLDESLRFADVPGDGGGKSIFTGSADGVVTRFVLNSATKAFDVAAQSVPLGFGAFALAVGDLSDGHAGLEVAVGTKEHLFTLDALTLSVLNWREVPRTFEHARPRRMQIADVFSGPDFPGKEVITTTLMGHVLVFSGDGFGDLVDFGEPGVQDLAVLEGHVSAASTTTSNTPILLLSHRGHLAHVTLNKVADPTQRNPGPAELQAWTAGEEGTPMDLEIVSAPVGGGPVAVALYAHQGTDGTNDVPQIRCFDALTMHPTSMATHGIPPSLGWFELGTLGRDVLAADLAPVHLSSGALAGFVVMLSARIVWVPINGSQPQQPAGYKLDGFAPASRAIAVTTADIATRSGGETYKEEIILSTLGGHVVWFHLEDMLANGPSVSRLRRHPAAAADPTRRDPLHQPQLGGALGAARPRRGQRHSSLRRQPVGWALRDRSHERTERHAGCVPGSRQRRGNIE
ncbi:MAG: hypothetical protein U1F36_19860 [Planctomycetota bacterium]